MSPSPQERRHLPWLSIAAVGLAVLAFAHPPWAEALIMRFDGPWWLEPWRLLTCHWVHWSFEHLLWDACTLALVGWLAERRSRATLAATLLVAAVTIPAAVAATTTVDSYAGLSGLDMAVYALIATDLVFDRWRDASAALRAVIVLGILGLGAKLIFEAVTGQLLFVSASDAGFVVVPIAHLTGALSGASVGLVHGALRRTPGPAAFVNPGARAAIIGPCSRP